MRRATLAAALLIGSPAYSQQQADSVVAQRGSVTLTANAVREMVRNADPDVRRQLETQPGALASYVRDRLLQIGIMAEARDHQWDTKPDVIYRADRAREASITEGYLASVSQPEAGYPADDEIASAYEANKSRLMVPRQYHLAQIFASVAAGTAAGAPADTDAQKELAALRDQITRGRGDFTALARKQSDDKSSAASGGDIGWVREDQLAPALRSIVPGLAEGAVSDPVRIGDGWHLVKLLGTRPAAPAPLSDVRDALVRALRQQKQQQNAQAYLAGLQKQQPVKLNEIELSGLTGK